MMRSEHLASQEWMSLTKLAPAPELVPCPLRFTKAINLPTMYEVDAKAETESTRSSEEGCRGPSSAVDEEEDREQAPATTVMLRNIACRFTQSDVKAAIDEVGLEGTYDFIFVPLCPSKRSNRGYAFVNFRHSRYVELCRARFAGKVFGHSNTQKLCEVTLAHIQGLVNSSVASNSFGALNTSHL